MTIGAGPRRALGALDETLRGNEERWGSIVRGVIILGVIGAAWVLGSSPSPQLAGVLFLASVMFVLIRAPHLAIPGLIVGIAIIPYELNRGGASINFAILGVAALSGYWVINMALDQRFALPRSESNVAWAMLMGIAAMSILAGSAFWNPMVSVKSNFLFVQLAQLSIYVLSAAAFWLSPLIIKTRSELRWLVMIVLVNGVFVVFGNGLNLLAPIRSRMLLDSVNTVVWFVALTMGLALFHTDLDRRVRWVLVALATAAVAVPLARGGVWVSGWLTPLLALSTMVFLRLGRSSFRLVVALSPFIPFAIVVFLRRLIIFESWSFDTRLIAWRGLLDLVADRWIFGLGLASYGHYWRAVIGSFTYFDPVTGYLHSTTDPKVNMHNNYLDIYGQMGALGLIAYVLLLWLLVRQAWRIFQNENGGFGQAYAAACVTAVASLSAASMLGDYMFPFVYNVGLRGFRDSSVGWLMLGGMIVLERTSRMGTEADDS